VKGSRFMVNCSLYRVEGCLPSTEPAVSVLEETARGGSPSCVIRVQGSGFRV